MFTPAITPPADAAGPAWWLAFAGNKLLLLEKDGRAQLPCTVDLGLPVVRQLYLGTLDGRPCYAAELAAGVEPPAGMKLWGLRQLYSRLDEELFWLAGRAFQIVDWDRTHQFCGRCGTKTEAAAGERARVCPACGQTHYPRVAPAVIVSVVRGDEILLARSPRHPPGFYSVIAGFVEAGETLEETVVREVQEETGIRVQNIRYFGSQPWPFPHSLMVGFTADYAGGELTIDRTELEDAGWYTAANLPLVPMGLTIARRLIDAFVARRRQDTD